MRKKAASTFSSGGGGFTFADKVAASFLLKILKGTSPFDPKEGVIRELHFEVRESGQALDDLLLVLDANGVQRHCLMSLKSNTQLTRKGFSADFAETAWDQWLNPDRTRFNPPNDLLALVVGIAEENALQEWRELQQQASSTTPERLVLRLKTRGQSSAEQRAIFKSLRVKTGNTMPGEEETAQLVGRLRVQRFSQESEQACLDQCTELVRDGRREAGSNLWGRLLQCAAENRPVGGFVDLTRLLDLLRGHVELKDFPEIEADWRRLEALSAQNVQSVRGVVGGDIRLARPTELDSLRAALGTRPVMLLIGESGSGKSSLLSRLATSDHFARVVWLTAPQCSKTSQAEWAQSIGMRHPVTELVARSTIKRSLLVLDAFEQFQGDARARALEVLRVLRESHFDGWCVAFTCQPIARRAVKEFLIETAVDAGEVGEHDLDKPSLADVVDAVKAVPGIGLLMLREELQPILRNLVVLDWILKGNIVGGLAASTQTWIGETTLIDRIWEAWTGASTMRLARDGLLRGLAKNEGARISGAVHIDTVDADQLPLLGVLETEGLIVINGPSVRFSHDLIGDWARYRSLVFWNTEAAVRVLEQVTNPRWARAIRLFAQRQAEQGGDLMWWRSFNDQFNTGSSEAQLASDLFLDGLLFAANSAALLELVWPDLVKDQGQILVRMLKRLLHVASRPDSRILLLVGERDAEGAESWARIPEPHYWYPALYVLSRHATEVASFALILAAEVCALWLRTMPERMPGRHEAGLLALELAKETQAKMAEGLNFGEQDRPVHEALLSATPEFPEEVVAIALELSARRDEPQHAIDRRKAWRAEEARRQAEWTKANPEAVARRRRPPPPVSLPESPIRPPFPDGPRRRVPAGFRSAVLDTPAFDSLTRSRSASAKEVLLAVCLDEPKPWNRYGVRHLAFDSLGLEHWQRGYPPAYWKGPFWKLLQTAPTAGLETIIALVNHATARWLEFVADEVTFETATRYGLEFMFEGTSVCWIGNGHVYGWHRQVPLGGNAVGCALMALERWLYDEVQQHRSIEGAIRHIFTQSKSLAFAGVLVSLGLKHPALLAGELQPLLGNMDLYFCQQNWSVAEQHGDTALGMSSDEPFDRLVKEWNAMPHRRAVLWDVATTLMLRHEPTFKYLADRRAEWQTRVKETQGNRERLEFFLARFDPGNYTHTELPDGRVCVSMRWPPHMEAIVQKSKDERDMKMLALTMQSQARQCLSGAAEVPLEQLPDLLNQAKRLAEWVPTKDETSIDTYRLNSIAGALAVLVIQHREWLRSIPENERWCLEALRNFKLPNGSEFDSSSSLVDHTAESFLGEAGIALLQESDDEPWILGLICGGLAGYYYGSTLQVMWRAYMLRESLGSRFDELVNAVVTWSALRYAAESESGYHADRELLTRYRRSLLARLAAGRLKGRISLDRSALLSKRLIKRMHRKKMTSGERRQRQAHEHWVEERRRADRELYRKSFNLDTQVLQKGFVFVFAMIRNPLPSDQEKLREYMHCLFQFEMGTFPLCDTGYWKIEGTPYQFDMWLLQRAAEYAAHCGLDEAKLFYEPILTLGPPARYWVEGFLQAWVTLGLESGVDRVQFVKKWQTMVSFADSLPAWLPGDGNYWSPAESLAIDLLGLHQEASAVLGQSKQQDVVTAMLPTITQWCDRWLKFATVSAWFAAFLPTGSGQVLLPMGIKKLAVAANSFSNHDWGQKGLGGLLTEALAACWRIRRQDIRADADLRQAFLNLMTLLCARQIPEALHLRSKVAGSLDESPQS